MLYIFAPSNIKIRSITPTLAQMVSSASQLVGGFLYTVLYLTIDICTNTAKLKAHKIAQESVPT